MNITNNIKNYKSNLASRIFFICFFLLILPLFIYNIVLYQFEYNQKIDDITNTLNLLANEKVIIIDTILESKKNILNDTLEELNNLPLNKINDFLNITKESFGLSDIYFLKIENKNIFNADPSNKEIKNYSFLKDLINKEYDIFQCGNLLCKDCIYLSKVANNKILIIGVSPENILFKIPKNEFFFDILINIYNTDKSFYIGQKDQDLDFFKIEKNLNNFDLQLLLKIDLNEIKKTYKNQFFFKNTFKLIILFALVLFFLIFLIKLFSKPLNYLLNLLFKIKKGDRTLRYQNKKFGFEINTIGNVLNETLDSLISHQNQLIKEKIDKQKYIDEMEIARDIQLSMLPDKILNNKDLDLSFGYLPAKEVGGDFFDFIEKKDKTFFIIADICGKGIPACLYALNLRSILRAYISVTDSLNEILVKTNDLFIKDTEKKYIFATLFIAEYDNKTANLKYASMGHGESILKRNNEIISLKTQNKALGIEKIEKTEIKDIKILKNDLLFVYSDGVTDLLDIKHQAFGIKNLERFLQSFDDKDSKKLIEDLLKKLKEFSKDIFQYDDISLFSIFFK